MSFFSQSLINKLSCFWANFSKSADDFDWLLATKEHNSREVLKAKNLTRILIFYDSLGRSGWSIVLRFSECQGWSFNITFNLLQSISNSNLRQKVENFCEEIQDTSSEILPASSSGACDFLYGIEQYLPNENDQSFYKSKMIYVNNSIVFIVLATLGRNSPV